MLFNELINDKDILDALDAVEINSPSEIQEKAIPMMLSGIDMIGQAQTGTGKTFAYGIPLVMKSERSPFEALVLCPTRELAIQVSKELQKLLKFKRGIRVCTVYGGESYDKQIRELKRNPQILVGTPGRIIDHMNRKTINLSNLKTLVLDEADEMLKMGFQDDLETILSTTPATRQTVLFSATMPEFIKKVALNYQNNPEHITIAKKTLTVDKIKQEIYYCKRESKMDLLIRILDLYHFKSAMIFANTKSKVDDIVSTLEKNHYSVGALHGDLKQATRDRVMESFKNGHINILSCTDVAARGIDVKGLEVIINYDLPMEDETYVHRIGRTGRAGADGHSISFATESERKKVFFIEKFTKSQMTEMPIPSKEDILLAQMNKFYFRVMDNLENDIEPNLALINKLAKLNVEPAKLVNALISLSYDASVKDYPEIMVAKKKTEVRSKDSRRSDNSRFFKDSNSKDKKDKRPFSKEKSYMLAHINVGKKEGVRPQILLSYLGRVGGVRKENVGDIIITNNGTDIEITRQAYNYLMKLEGKDYNGTRLNIRKLKDRSE